jgi:hypothetical protein
MRWIPFCGTRRVMTAMMGLSGFSSRPKPCMQHNNTPFCDWLLIATQDARKQQGLDNHLVLLFDCYAIAVLCDSGRMSCAICPRPPCPPRTF